MSSPPPDNILLDPLPELTAALESHAFGLTSFSILTGESYPRNEREREAVRAQHASTGGVEGVVGRAEVVLLAGEGVVLVRFDQRGYTVESTTPPRDAALPGDQRTFESLDALLIALSPAYVAAMQSELMKRFEGGPGPSRWRDLDDSDGDDGAEEDPAWID